MKIGFTRDFIISVGNAGQEMKVKEKTPADGSTYWFIDRPKISNQIS